jgi:uracil-DNA glycosylase family 4
MSDLFTDDEAIVEKESPLHVLSAIAGSCAKCRLCAFDRDNMGISYDGSTSSKVAFLGDLPEVEGSQHSIRRPIAGEARNALDKWIVTMGLEPDCVFIVNTVQCKTFKGRRKRNEEVRAPFAEEIDACFPDRALRVLQAMPKLEVVVACGMTAAAALLGRNPEPKVKSHEGQWFGTDYLPGVAVLVMDHPRDYGREADRNRAGKQTQICKYFRTEYTETGKIRDILQYSLAKRSANNL